MYLVCIDFKHKKRYVIYSFIHVPILYQIGHISDIFGNPVQNRYTFFVPVKMYQFCTFFRCGELFPFLIFCNSKHVRCISLKVLKLDTLIEGYQRKCECESHSSITTNYRVVFLPIFVKK